MARSKKDRSSKKKKSGLVIKGGLASVETRRLIAKGPHVMRVVEVEPGEGDAGNYLKWEFEVTEGKFKGSRPKPYYTTLAEGKLWNLKKVLSALGNDAAESDDDIDLEEIIPDLIDQEVVGIVGHEEYEGRLSAAIVEFGDEDDVDEDDDEDDEEEEKSSKKSDKKDSKKGGKKKPAEDDEEDDEEDDDDEEDPSEESINEMDEDELEEFCATNDLDVELPKKLSKARAAVVKAAKKAKLI